jgi:hypothetical protein
MARKAHKVLESEAAEDTREDIRVILPPELKRFLETEAKRIRDNHFKKCTPQILLRALLTAYYEKRMIGLLVDPDD